MGVLSHLEPAEVFDHFEKICSIPHGSGNVERISDYLVGFAKERGLEHYQDAKKNVIIVKEATPGYEEQEPLILQGHMDMVAVKTADSDLDLENDGLLLRTEGDLIYGEGTSLGGDDGIAVAYALAVLDSRTLRHPRIEVVITVDEEVGMNGARAIDLSMLKGHKLLNIDSEEEGIFTVGCAGGARVDLTLSLDEQEMEGTGVCIQLQGLAGGHSGMDIHKERGNSNVLMGRVLERLCHVAEVHLLRIEGGLADNAIPRETELELLVSGGESAVAGMEEELQILQRELREEYATRDPELLLVWNRTERKQEKAVSARDTLRSARLLCGLPNGVQAMSPDVPGLVETSLNLGILRMRKTTAELTVGFSVRSSVESEKKALIRKLIAIGSLAGASYEVRGNYPGWKYRVNSPLRERMVELYREMYEAEPDIVTIHAGLECGLFMDKINDLECVSFGPNMKNIHTTEETLSISSTKRVWEYLVRLLETKF